MTSSSSASRSKKRNKAGDANPPLIYKPKQNSMIEIDGKVDPNAFREFDKLIQGKKEVIFARLDVKPLRVYENWKGEEQGYGPSGSPVNIGEKHAITIPMEFVTLKYHDKENKQFDQVTVRYYRSKSPVTYGNVTTFNYDAGDGNPNFTFSGSSMRLNVQTAEGKELFRVLMAHPCNADHPEHGARKTPLFKLLRPELESKSYNEREKLVNKAIGMVYNALEVPNGLAIKMHKRLLHDNPGLGWVPTEELEEANDFDTLRSNLASYAKLHPDDVVDMIKSANLGLRNTISEAVDLMIIDHNEKKWFWGEKIKKNNRDICVIPVGDDAVDTLIAFLLYDKAGKKTTETIQAEVERLNELEKQVQKTV